MKYDIITFGSALLDVFIKSSDIKIVKSKEVYTDLALIMPYGVKSEAEDLTICSGGGGTNTAVGFTRLGLKTALVARLGWDPPGRVVRQEIKKEKVFDELVVQLEGERTDYSTVLRGPDGNRTILVWRGGTRLEKSVIDFKKLNGFWFYISSLEGNLGLIKDLINHAVENHIKVVLNPGKREIEAKDELLELAQVVDVFVVNRLEAERLTGMTAEKKSVADRLGYLLPKPLVAVTEGAKGASLVVPGRGRLVMSGIDVRVVEKTGSGDAFGAGFISGLSKGWTVEKSFKLGIANGASVATKVGAKDGLIRETEVEFWLSQTADYHWDK